MSYIFYCTPLNNDRNVMLFQKCRHFKTIFPICDPYNTQTREICILCNFFIEIFQIQIFTKFHIQTDNNGLSYFALIKKKNDFVDI